MKHFRNSVFLGAVLSVLMLALVAGVTVNSSSWGPFPPPDDDGLANTLAWGPFPPPDDDGISNLVAWGPFPPPDDDGNFAQA